MHMSYVLNYVPGLAQPHLFAGTQYIDNRTVGPYNFD